MRTLKAVTLLLVLAAGPAHADGMRLVGLPSALLSGDAAEGTQHELPNPPAPSITAGPVTIVLGETRLSDLHDTFGGTLRHAATGSASADWLCYSVATGSRPQLVWFVSDGEAGGPSRLVTLVGANYADPKPTCDPAGSNLDGITLPAPGLGAGEADLAAKFGAVAARNGMVAYANQTPASAGGSTTFQSLNYLLDGETIIGLAASQITIP